jgi:uncharacterized membrane protein YozB (DUF420 family)
LIGLGLFRRHDRKIHPKIMKAAFVVDISLVLYLELTRGAINRASQLASQLLTFHVSVAVLTILLNVVLLWSGWRILQGEDQRQGFHRKLALFFVLARITTFLTAFLIPAR